MTSESLSMRICRYGRIYNVQFHAASPACVDYAASEVMCRCLCSTHWLLHLSSADWTIVTVSWSAYRASLIQRLQSVQNAAARFIYSIKRYEHITDALISLHWLRVQQRIVFKVAVLTYRAVHGTAPKAWPGS